MSKSVSQISSRKPVDKGAGALFFLALILPLFAMLTSIGVELTAYFSALESAQALLDEAVLRAEPYFPDSSRVQQSIAETIKASSMTLPNRLDVELQTVSVTQQSVRAELKASLGTVGLGLMNLFNVAEDNSSNSLLSFSVSAEARPQSIDIIFLFDAWREAVLPVEPLGLEEGVSPCVNHAAIPVLKLAADINDRLNTISNHRTQIMVTPYKNQVVTTFSVQELASELIGRPDSACLGSVKDPSQSVFASFSEMLIDFGAQSTRPYDSSFIGSFIKSSFNSGNDDLIQLRDPIKYVVIYMPLFGRAPATVSIETFVPHILRTFEALSQGINKKTISFIALYPQSETPFPNMLKIKPQGGNLDISVLDSPINPSLRYELLQLLLSSFHSGVLAK